LCARYRNSFTAPERLDSGAIYEIRLDLWATANVLLPGHRVRLRSPAATLFGTKGKDIPCIRMGAEMGLCEMDLNEIKIEQL